jgi:hypothetical protein
MTYTCPECAGAMDDERGWHQCHDCGYVPPLGAD